jgi:hypothetical protein
MISSKEKNKISLQVVRFLEKWLMKEGPAAVQSSNYRWIHRTWVLRSTVYVYSA